MDSLSKSKLRWCWERTVILLAFLINLALIGFAILIVVESAELVRRRPETVADVEKVRSLAVLGILALPALALDPGRPEARIRRPEDSRFPPQVHGRSGSGATAQDSPISLDRPKKSAVAPNK